MLFIDFLPKTIKKIQVSYNYLSKGNKVLSKKANK